MQLKKEEVMAHAVVRIQHEFKAHRLFNVRVDSNDINNFSLCAVSLTEGRLGGAVFGRATMRLYNVSPGVGFVNIRGEIDWDTDLPIRADIIVVNTNVG
jgi:hypothetical protein